MDERCRISSLWECNLGLWQGNLKIKPVLHLHSYIFMKRIWFFDDQCRLWLRSRRRYGTSGSHLVDELLNVGRHLERFSVILQSLTLIVDKNDLPSLTFPCRSSAVACLYKRTPCSSLSVRGSSTGILVGDDFMISVCHCCLNSSRSFSSIQRLVS